jgi:hypothetical protein
MMLVCKQISREVYKYKWITVDMHHKILRSNIFMKLN